MAQLDVIMPAQPTDALPQVRSIQPRDLRDALAKGLEDFWAMPTHVIFICLMYPIIGLLLGRLAFGYDFIPLLYPLAAGFTLIGPLAAIGLYELSRRREAGMDTSWRHAFDVVHSPSFPAIAALGGLLLVILLVWVACAQAIYDASFGRREFASAWDFIRAVVTTPEGHNLILIGNAVGFLFAVVSATLSVVSFPLLLDRNVGLPVAMLTSIKAVLKNPVTMAMWGVIVAAALVLGSIPFFIGLAVVMPILGHATWHLYRKVIVPDTSPRPEFHPRPKGIRYAADFPSSLFAPSSRAKEE
jgi:uncharacterized membrane protein